MILVDVVEGWDLLDDQMGSCCNDDVVDVGVVDGDAGAVAVA